MKYSDVVKKFIGKKGLILGDQFHGFLWKPYRDRELGDKGLIKEVGDDFVLLEVSVMPPK
ncbi:hypothetical protein [Desulfosarcina variabilis]|uniref:hypothetical protein n=1 Tax=Desulfosarcina variabilis TaxID=2300 RepID=UPI003AFA17A0